MANASDYVPGSSIARGSQTLDTARFANLGSRERIIDSNRRPFRLSCLSWEDTGRAIDFWVNPKEITWNFKLRGVLVPVKGGTISYQWRASNAARGGIGFFDEPRCTFTFQTGNIMPIRNGGTPVPPGLLDFYEFLELMNEPLVLDNGGMNYRLIYYRSLAFPDLLLVGFFDPTQAISITEAAEDPAQFTWSAEFVIRRTTPEFFNAAQLAQVFLASDAPQGLGTTGTQANSGQFGADTKDNREGSEVGVSATQTDLQRNEAPPAAPLAPGIGTARNLGDSLRPPQRTT